MLERHPSRRTRGGSGVMGDEYNGVARAVQAVEQSECLACGRGVKASGRFVRQHNGRAGDDRARDRNTLLLSAGKLIRPMLQPVGQADAAERRFGAFQPFRTRHALQSERQRDIFQCGHAGQQAEALKDKADARAAQLRE